jgi:hypothetical protein
MKDRFFAPTLPDDVQLHQRFEQIDGAGSIQDPSWRRAITLKVEFILHAIDAEMGGVFAFTDVDVQFFGSFRDWFSRSLAGNDMVFQTDAPGPALCTGFFFCHANTLTRTFWEQVLAGVRASEGRDDDQVVARRLAFKAAGLKWSCLPTVFFGGGTLTGRGWNPGDELPIPDGILMHHANFTIGVPNKIRQLEYVRERVLRGGSTLAQLANG